MKKIFFLIAACAISTLLSAQAKQKPAERISDDALSEIIASKSFTKKDQTDIQKILGKDFSALIDSKGHLVITVPTSISQIKSTPAGEFLPFTELKQTPKLIFWWGKGEGFILKKYLQTKMSEALGEERSKELISLLIRK